MTETFLLTEEDSGSNGYYIIWRADGDGEVSDWDGVTLARYLAGWPVEVVPEALDIDGDGEVTDWDGVLMDRYLAGWDVTIG